MYTKIKVLTLAAAMFIYTGCDNGSTTTADKDTDSTKMSNETTDIMDKKMDMDKMESGNGSMTAMNNMMDKMSGMQMSGDFDMDFANMMIEHHQGAIDMSEAELKSGTDEKMKAKAQDIITKQREEIGKLKEYVAKMKKSDMKMGEGVLEKSMAEMKSKMSGMQMTGNADKDFATMMISHHEGAIKMSKEELSNGMNNELKHIAKKAIADQTKEISEFKSWLAANK